MHQREIDKVKSVGKVIEALIKQQSARATLVAKLLQAHQGLAAGLARKETRSHALDRRRPGAGATGMAVDILEVTDEKGTVVYRLQEPSRRGDRLKGWGIEEALAGNSILTSDPRCRRRGHPETSSRSRGNRIVGTIIVGVRLNDQLMSSLSAQVGADLALVPACRRHRGDQQGRRDPGRRARSRPHFTRKSPSTVRMPRLERPWPICRC